LAASASPGRYLTVPPATAAPTALPVVYIVQANDNLGTIAALYGVTVEAILQANPEILDPNVLVAGQQIVIPVSATQAAAITPPPTSVSPLTPAAPTAGAIADLPRSIFEGDLASAYPRTLAGPRVTIHYQPACSPTDRAGDIPDNAEETLAFIGERLGVTHQDTF
jgi:LysM repeat protein